jgi:MYXO-CTERM domain-containing protein
VRAEPAPTEAGCFSTRVQKLGQISAFWQPWAVIRPPLVKPASTAHAPLTATPPAFWDAASRKLAFAVPLVVTMLRTSPSGQWRDDLPAVRALGLVPSGAEGTLSTAFTQLLALLPIGGRLLRAGWVSAIGLAVASAVAYRLIHRALSCSLDTPRLSPPLALAATLTAVLAPSWQLEGTLAGGVTVGVTLALTAIWVALTSHERWSTLLLGALIGCTVTESHPAALALGVALLALLLLRRRWPEPHSALELVLGVAAPLAPWSLYLLLRPLSPNVELNLSGGIGTSSLVSVDAAAERTTALAAWVADAGLISCALGVAGLLIAVFRKPLRALGAPFAALFLFDLGFPASKVGILASDSLAPVRLLSLIAIACASALAVQALATYVRRARLPFAEPASALLVAFHFTLAFAAVEASAYAADRRDQVAADSWTDAALSSLPPSALLLVRSEALAYRLWSAQIARGARTDLIVIPQPLLERGNVAQLLLRQEPALAPLVREMALAGEPSEFSLSSLSDTRPLFVEIDPRWPKRLRNHLAPRAFFPRFAAHPLGRSDRSQSLKENDAAWQRALLIAAAPGARDAATLAVMQSELRDRAQLLVDLGDREAAQTAVQSLFGIDPHDTVAATLSARLALAHDSAPASTQTPR